MTSLIRQYDQLVFPAGVTAQTLTNVIRFQRTHQDYGTFQVDVADVTDFNGGDLFILGRPVTGADYVTLLKVTNIQNNLDPANIYTGIPLMHRMVVFWSNVDCTIGTTTDSWVQGS